MDEVLHHLWMDPEATATALLISYVDHAGDKGLGFDPEAIFYEVRDMLGGEPPEIAFDKLLAAITLNTTDYAFKSSQRFMIISVAANGGGFHPGCEECPDAAEAAWTLTESLLLSPPERNDHHPVSPEVCHLLGRICEEEGIFHPTDVLRIAILPPRPSMEYDDESASTTLSLSSHRAREVSDFVKQKLHRLADEVGSISLRSGDARDLIDRLKLNLRPKSD